jgi:hypothetical protein
MRYEPLGRCGYWNARLRSSGSSSRSPKRSEGAERPDPIQVEWAVSGRVVAPIPTTRVASAHSTALVGAQAAWRRVHSSSIMSTRTE